MLFYHKRRKHTTHTTKIKGKFDRFLLDISTFRGYFRAYKCQTPGFSGYDSKPEKTLEGTPCTSSSESASV